MAQFQELTFNEYVPRPDLPPRSEHFAEATKVDAKKEPVLHLVNGKHMSLFKYLKWQVTTRNYHTREDLMQGSITSSNGDNFERALVHPMFDSTLQKVFAMDRTLEIQHSFRHRLLQTNWLRFTEDKSYLTVDESMQTLWLWCDTHNISMTGFVEDVWTVMQKTKSKLNLLFLEGCLIRASRTWHGVSSP